MYGYPHPTPCPGTFPHPILRPPHPYPYIPYAAPSLSYDRASLSQRDDTSNLEYTTELQPQPRNPGVRRPGRRTHTFNPTTDIFEDEAQRSEATISDAGKRRDKTSTKDRVRRDSILYQPPQRIPGLVTVPAPAPRETLATKPRRKRVSEVLAERAEPGAKAKDKSKETWSHGDQLQKDPRRRTIYVPSEDTSIMTIHPGAPTRRHEEKRAPRSPDLGFDLVTLSEEDPDEIKSVLKKGPSRKSLAVAPKRVPLRQTSRSVQSVTFSDDKIGSGDGKENLPPGKTTHQTTKRSSMINRIVEGNDDRAGRRNLERKPKERVAVSKTKAVAGQKRISSEGDHANSPVLKSLKARADSTATEITSKRRQTVLQTKRRSPATKSPAGQNAKQGRAPNKLSVPFLTQKDRASSIAKYPMLSEDISKPELYEENWLNHQEIALTQLLNCLFQSAEAQAHHQESDIDLRRKLLAVYNDGTVATLHKKLLASLQFGALSIPKDLLTNTVRLKEDLGLRRKFLNLWLETYDLQVLQAAAETVIGRQIPPTKRTSESEGTTRHPRHQRKALEEFLDVFLIRNEDAVKFKPGVGTIASIARVTENQQDDFGSQAWSWRRTVLRSLMLILLLDKAKSSRTFTPCLFQNSSSHKSSLAVLNALASIVLPSLGDIVRPLSHLQYVLQSVQYPLEEYTYHVDNLATDLRDGVLLTRVIELLLYPPATLVTLDSPEVTLTLPTGEQLTTIFDVRQLCQTTWVLSHHLKFPCLGRAQKTFNVQIALSALNGVKGIASRLVEDITADDIVDGHREKTLGLLWGLVGRCGLSTLINYTEVAKETRRLRLAWQNSPLYDSGSECSSDEEEVSRPPRSGSSFKQYARLLHKWAQAIGRLRDVRVSNLTTSFADGRAFEAIVDEYLPYCSPAASLTSSHNTISSKLASIGCNHAFTSLFYRGTSTSTAFPIPARDFTISSLAFLASRLLPLVRTARAAAVIQRAYRLRLARRELSKRLALLRLATHCAIVVRTRERVVNAAVILQRAWRQVLDRRIGALVGDIVRVQSLARAWKVRRRMKKGPKRERVRGGW